MIKPILTICATFVVGCSGYNSKLGSGHRYQTGDEWPNPFSPITSLSFSIPKESQVTITVYDTLGAKVCDLLHEYLSAGSHKVELMDNKNCSGLPSGVYFYKLEAGEFVETKKMVLVR